MNNLEHFKTYLAGQYDAVLGMKLVESPSSAADQPIWLKDEDQAWLLDGEIGLALRIVPYLDAEQDLNTAIQRTLKTATLLQPRYGIRGDEADKHGIWQLGIIWLVEKPELGEAWRAAIADIRKESGFSEEIGLDAILVTEQEDLNAACLRHGLPQLLLHMRRLFGMDWSKMPSWLSANTRVAEMLKSFPARFIEDVEASRLVSTLVREVSHGETPDSNKDDNISAIPAPVKKSLEAIEIRNFRNIGHCYLRFQKNKDRHTQAHIIFGPNGTGKTSIFEALCLAVGGVSRTWGEFEIDSDIESRVRDYPTAVLSPLHGGGKPEVFFNGTSIPLRSMTSAQANWRDLEGSFLGQEDSREFLGEHSDQLAQRILKGYSTLADRVTELASARERAARDEKTAWLKEHGLSASITRRETRAQRLIEGEIQKESLSPSQSLLDWLEHTSRFVPNLENEGQRLATRWKGWRNQQGGIVEKMATGVLLGESSLIRQTLAGWLTVRNTLLGDTHAFVTRASSFIESLRGRLEGVEKELDAWGEWLVRQASQKDTSTSEELQSLMRQIESAREELKELRQRVVLERKHAAHLNQLKTEFLSSWSRENPDTCPTCGQDHRASGGIERVVGEIQSAVERRLTEREQQDKTMATALAALEARLSALGLCPVSEQRQKVLQDLLTPFSGDRPLQSLLINAEERGALKNSLKDAQTLPGTQTSLPIDKLEEMARKVAERSMSLDAEAERLWPLPERWGKIVKTLKDECDLIVAQHLPDTLQKLWWEIALAMTPARWNLAAKPVFQVKDRGKLIVGVKERADTPAHYLFNQAERHVMGLAWFFTRYLTHGRFHRALMALDDPAQEMDQTTFRSFARFAQALLRLHETRQVPMHLVLFLHQEDRGLDMARATLGRFLTLTWRMSWTNVDTDNMWEVRLLSEGFLPPNAVALLTPKVSAGP